MALENYIDKEELQSLLLPIQLLSRMYASIYGTTDLHSHIRWRAIKEYINFQSRTILDVGCGSGIMTVEIGKHCPNLSHIIGITPKDNSIKMANVIAESQGVKNVEFRQGNALNLEFPDETFDEITCFDVLEHISDDNKATSEMSRVLKRGGQLVISIPTPDSVKYFGRQFLVNMQNVRDGYQYLEAVKLLNDHGLKIQKYKYYTLLPSSLLCAIYYRHLYRKRIGSVISPIFNALSFLDVFSPQKYRCSIALIAEKQ